MYPLDIHLTLQINFSNTYTIQGSTSTPQGRSGLVNSHLPSSVERLKPPPSAINTDRKVIKLGSGSGVKSSSGSNVERSPKVTESDKVNKTKITFGSKSPSVDLNSGMCLNYSFKQIFFMFVNIIFISSNSSQFTSLVD